MAMQQALVQNRLGKLQAEQDRDMMHKDVLAQQQQISKLTKTTEQLRQVSDQISSDGSLPMPDPAVYVGMHLSIH
eukprot:3073980-Alexandrium_andersonii.AAC.1